MLNDKKQYKMASQQRYSVGTSILCNDNSIREIINVYDGGYGCVQYIKKLLEGKFHSLGKTSESWVPIKLVISSSFKSAAEDAIVVNYDY
jgi:hypothetical protein